ncbi:MAG: translation initiation factor IF-6 [Candidatus Thermoplasmatota archaeon]|jgi:translation initiation factor 6|nr:translation initiation factor IF-6 [Candidatus Thermoplasmatota archaeon]
MNQDKTHLELLDFNENPNVGVYCRTNEDIAFVRKGLSKKVKNILQSVLDVKVVELSIADATIIGSLLCLNSNGAIVTDFADDESVKTIEDNGLEVCIIKDKLNAAGNDILVNDKGALVHPDLKDESIDDIRKTLKVPVYRGTIGSLKTVGMAAVVTNKGLLCHPKASEEEKSKLEKVFGVNVMIGTVNHGSPVIGSGLVANTKGAIIGKLTTGIEMGRIEEALGYLD